MAFFAFVFTLLNGIADAAPIFLAALLHEGGHLLCCCILRVPVRWFRPSLFGAVIGYDASRISYGQEAAVAISGPFLNLLSALAVLPLRGRFFALFGVASLGLAFFNLLPLQKLDGGVLLRAVLLSRLEPGNAERIISLLSRGASVILFILASVAALRADGNLSLLLLSVYFLFFL